MVMAHLRQMRYAILFVAVIQLFLFSFSEENKIPKEELFMKSWVFRVAFHEVIAGAPRFRALS